MVLNRCHVNQFYSFFRVLSVWFDYGDKPRIAESVIEGLKMIQIENWLQVTTRFSLAFVSRRHRFVCR